LIGVVSQRPTELSETMLAPLPTRLQIYKPDPEPKSNDVDCFTSWREGGDDIDID